ncbi:MAG: helix-turn-helix transcriptional regulator [Terracidiphilus sp.]
MILSTKPYKPKSKFLWVVGNHLRDERVKAGLTQDELSNRAKIVRSQLCDIELGKVNLKVETMLRITEALGINLGELMGAIMADYLLG